MSKYLLSIMSGLQKVLWIVCKIIIFKIKGGKFAVFLKPFLTSTGLFSRTPDLHKVSLLKAPWALALSCPLDVISLQLGRRSLKCHSFIQQMFTDHVPHSRPGSSMGVHRKTVWIYPCPWGDSWANRKLGAHPGRLPTQCWCIKVFPESNRSDVT